MIKCLNKLSIQFNSIQMDDIYIYIIYTDSFKERYTTYAKSCNSISCVLYLSLEKSLYIIYTNMYNIYKYV